MKIAITALALILSAGAYAAGDATAGKALYTKSCQGCHGADGVANPKMAQMMKVDIKPLGSAEVQKLTDAEIVNVVTHGKGKMPAVRSVTGKSVDDVVAYIRTFKK